MMKPSFGIIACHHTGKKSIRKFNQGIESDFYPDFCCRKLKLKWNSAKFNSRQSLLMTSNLSTLTVTPTNTNLPTLGGNPSAPSSHSPLSIHPPFQSQLWYLTPLEVSWSGHRVFQLSWFWSFLTGVFPK